MSLENFMGPAGWTPQANGATAAAAAAAAALVACHKLCDSQRRSAQLPDVVAAVTISPITNGDWHIGQLAGEWAKSKRR